MADATVSDVRGVIATDLTDSEITPYINDAAYEAGEKITDYQTALSTEDRTQLEKYYAALLIRQLRDKSIKSTSRETASVNYESMTIAELKRKVDARDPSGQLAYNRDTDRYVSSTS